MQDIKKKAREMFDEEFPFGSFAGSSTKAGEVIVFIDQIIDMAIAESRQQTLEEVIANVPEEKYSKTEGTEDWDMVGGFNDCRQQTLLNLQALKDNNK